MHVSLDSAHVLSIALEGVDEHGEDPDLSEDLLVPSRVADESEEEVQDKGDGLRVPRKREGQGERV